MRGSARVLVEVILGLLLGDGGGLGVVGGRGGGGLLNRGGLRLGLVAHAVASEGDLGELGVEVGELELRVDILGGGKEGSDGGLSGLDSVLAETGGALEFLDGDVLGSLGDLGGDVGLDSLDASDELLEGIGGVVVELVAGGGGIGKSTT